LWSMFSKWPQNPKKSPENPGLSTSPLPSRESGFRPKSDRWGMPWMPPF
jgi:hypothetical protein